MSSMGHNNSEAQANLRRWLARKAGVPETALSSVGAVEMQQWEALKHSLPIGAPVEIQNADGSFPYLPGMDGPVTGS